MNVSPLLVVLVLGCAPMLVVNVNADSSAPPQSINFIASSPIVATSILMAGVPECTLQCGAPLLASIARAYEFPSNALLAFTTMCSEYELALKCVRDSAGSDCTGPNYFDIFTSGIRFACEDFRVDFNDLYAALGSRQPGINQACSTRCNISEVADAFDNVTSTGSSSAGALMRSSSDPEDKARQALVKADLDVLCSGVKCVLDCSSASIDKIIPGFGVVFQKLDRLPWELTGLNIKQQPDNIRSFFNGIMPNSCWALTQPVQIFGTSGESSGVEGSGSD